MKIKVEFEINTDLNELERIYGKEAMQKYYYTDPKTHLRGVEVILKNRFNLDFTNADITNFVVSKGYFKNGKYIFDEAVFTDIL